MADYEKGEKGVSASPDIYTTNSQDGVVTGLDDERLPLATRLGVTPDSFRRRTLADKHNQLNKTLKTRHLHMIAIGGSIGAGLFVGSGSALSNGGPASLLICFAIIGIVSSVLHSKHYLHFAKTYR